VCVRQGRIETRFLLQGSSGAVLLIRAVHGFVDIVGSACLQRNSEFNVC
jgi:hypothetical protein